MRSQPKGGVWAATVSMLAVMVAGCGSTQTSSTPSASATTTTSGAAGSHAAGARIACTGSELAMSYGGTQGATGHLELTVNLRNVSDHACVVRGYPAARLLDRSGHALPLRVSRGHGFFPDTLPAPRPVTLGPDTAAHFGISFVTNNEYAHARVCRTAVMAMLAVPGSPGPRWRRLSLRSGPRISPCGDQLVVSPVHS